MQRSTLPIALVVGLGLALSGCAAPRAHQPTSTDSSPPSATTSLTSTPSPTPTATHTPTAAAPTPTVELTIEPGTISGAVILISNNETPFATTLELRTPEQFDLVGTSKSSSDGQFAFLGVAPGNYELWALISATNTFPPGCRDVLVDESSFRIGVKFGPDKALTSENPSMAMAILLISNLHSPDLIATGIYAVTDLSISSNSGVFQPVHLTCS